MAQQSIASNASPFRILVGVLGFFCGMSVPVALTMIALSVSDASLCS